MSKEEAINLLKQVNHILVNDDDYWTENTHEPLNTAFSMAIKALEQECEDVVSRQAVLDIVRFEENWLSDAKSNNADTDIAFSGIRTQVAKLSPVTCKKDGWIPCSERLPRRSGFYLCTTKDCITILEFSGGNHHYHEKPSFVSDILGRCNSYVVAWMPLPEPYKTEMEEEE